MSVRPLPGASYHTFDTFFHSFDHSDLEAAIVHRTSSCRPSEKKNFDGFDEPEHHVDQPALAPHPHSRGRHYRGPPVLLSVIVLCCLAFVASAFWSYSSSLPPLPDVPDRHAPLANYLSSAFRTQSSFRKLVDEHYDGALEMTFECAHGGCGEDLDLRHYLLQAFPLENPSVHYAIVGDSAVVLHWQGTDSNLKPVLITNSPAVLDVRAMPTYAQALTTSPTLPRGDDVVERFVELADIQSGVGVLIAADALIRSGYQPSRTLVFSLMLGDASDVPRVSEYLHDTYGELGLNMEYNPPVPECRSKVFRVLSVFHALIGRVSKAASALIFTPLLDNVRPTPDGPRLYRYAFNPAMNKETLSRLRIRATDAWVRLILGADGN